MEYKQKYDYGELLKPIGDIVLKIDQDEYQGYSWVLFRDGDLFGYLQFGWGSCSGCDALQACESKEEEDNLRTELATAVRWGTASETAAYLRTIDPSVSWGEEEMRRFVAEALAVLEVV